MFPPTKKFSRRVERWLPAAMRESFDRDVRRTRIFVRGAMGTIEVMIPTVLVLLVAGRWAHAALATVIGAFAGASMLICRSGRTALAIDLFLGVLMTFVTLSGWFAQDQVMGVWVWAPVVPLLALSVGGSRTGIRWLLIASFAVVLLWLLRVAGIAPPPGLHVNVGGIAVPATGVGVLFSVVGLVGAYENDMVKAIEESEARNRTLEATRADLEAHNRSLVEAQTRLEQLNSELLKARDEAEAGMRSRAEFLAVMSHEIRTPMNAVIGMTTLLLDSGLTAEQREFVETIRTSGDALLTVLTDTLDYSKIDAGRVELESLEFDPRVEIRQVVELMRAAASARGNALELTVDAAVPRRIRSDPGRVRQVLLNLVSNAVKFTSNGRVEVVVSHEAKPDSRLRVVVRDTGIGIAPELLPKIFQPFTQADASTTRRFGGTGLGLAISQRLAVLLGGTLSIESAPGVGSTLTLVIPVQPVREKNLTPFERRSAEVLDVGPSLRVLVAEDNPVNQKVIALMLKRMGHRVDTVSDGAEAVDALSRARYDLVLMDLQMPEMDGIEATQRLRARGETVRIVALTANVSAEERARCAEAGMNGFLAKPVRQDQLVAEVSRRR